MLEKATFAAGCFWGIEEIFRQVKGVIDTKVGYIGGDTINPTYHEVCSSRTGHAEAVQITFDPNQVPYDTLLEIFWNNHNPTQINRQGPDVGTQYRSVIFFHSEVQKNLALKSKKALEDLGKYNAAIATHIEPAPTFYPAEDYHQHYLAKRGVSHCGVIPKKD